MRPEDVVLSFSVQCHRHFGLREKNLRRLFALKICPRFLFDLRHVRFDSFERRDAHRELVSKVRTSSSHYMIQCHASTHISSQHKRKSEVCRYML
ncbi:hypothetical protein BVRB_004120 isoform C [Beta vulgaris subsp. vulgaris]|nr:hypothetical protein BVRB_004120 isoform C [Beta vulgaris subsp. vulgaris]